MISGRVLAGRYARVTVQVIGPSGLQLTVNADIDTGFDGALSLGASFIAGLGLPFASTVEANLPDDSTQELKTYRGTVIWHGQRLDLEIMEAEGTPLIGMALLEGSRVTLDVIDGGAVTIEPLP